MSFPERVHALERARRIHGDRADRLAAFLKRSDPLADACVEAFAALPPGRGFELLDEALRHGVDRVPDAPQALRDLFASVDHVPVWVDWERIDRGGQLLLRSGPFGGMVLGFGSLVLAYASPAGNKPLVLSGRLSKHAGRRLAETARFVHVVCLPASLRRFGEGFAMTLKVRLMHAQVRRLARRSGKWQTEAWGEPINQHDMLGTILVFSVALVAGLRKLGFRMSEDEVEAYMHLWRYVGRLMGVDDELLFSSEREGAALGEIMASMQGPADDDARALVAALFETGLGDAHSRGAALFLRGYRRFAQGLSRGLLGDDLADAVALPDDVFRYTVTAIRPAVNFAERVRERSKIVHQVALTAGNARWQKILDVSLGRTEPDFRPPEALARG